VKQGDEVGIFEQDRRVNVHHDPDDTGPARGEGTGREIGPVIGLLEDVEHLATCLLGNGATVDDPGDGGAGDTTQLR
jgi:hypothetical protein